MSDYHLTLMHNPAGAFLPASQAALEREWKDGLRRTVGVSFDRLIALNNLPISRFLDWLIETANLNDYLRKLVGAFNPAATSGLMCRDTLSIGWDGAVYDCDFNQMLELRAERRRRAAGRARSGPRAPPRPPDPHRTALLRLHRRRRQLVRRLHHLISEAPMKTLPHLQVDAAVRERYSAAAQATEPALCCAVSYDPERLKLIPEEVIERDYGCGDPTKYVRPGETVLDLGSGGGKACFLASQAVGAAGRVIGVDLNDEMLDLARRSAPIFAERIGFANVRFGRAQIQDLRLDRDRLDRWLAEHPIRSEVDFRRVEAEIDRLRREEPLVPDTSVDVVVSNCVLNLVRPEDKPLVFAEAFRVLKRGGRVVISDIVCDEDVPEDLRADPELWSGCISGALREDAFLRAFEAAGFYGLTILERQEAPWRTVRGIEFRSLTLSAYKGKEGPCWDHREAAIYKGPWKRVQDDDGHVLERGVRTAVCRKTYGILTSGPYAEQIVGVSPLTPVGEDEARPFPCTGGALIRDVRETKGEGYVATTEACPTSDCC